MNMRQSCKLRTHICTGDRDADVWRYSTLDDLYVNLAIVPGSFASTEKEYTIVYTCWGGARGELASKSMAGMTVPSWNLIKSLQGDIDRS